MKGNCLRQVQPDLEQLDVNMEDNEGVEEAKEEMKLGKLQFSLDYDFQKGEVTTDTANIAVIADCWPVYRLDQKSRP